MGRYLGRPEANGTRCNALGALGDSLLKSRPEEALPVLEANLALNRRYWPRSKETVTAESNVASCLDHLGRFDEALVLKREIYAIAVASSGASDEYTIMMGSNLSISMLGLGLWDEATTFTRDQLLPVARRSLGSDHDSTLNLNMSLAGALAEGPAHIRDLLEAETIMSDVVQRRRRVFGPAHPETIIAQKNLSRIRANLARA